MAVSKIILLTIVLALAVSMVSAQFGFGLGDLGFGLGGKPFKPGFGGFKPGKPFGGFGGKPGKPFGFGGLGGGLYDLYRQQRPEDAIPYYNMEVVEPIPMHQ